MSWVLAGKPRVVILELGGNDGLRGLGLPETRAHLDATIRQLKDAHDQVILAGMKLPPNYGEEYTTRFEAMYRDLAKLFVTVDDDAAVSESALFGDDARVVFPTRKLRLGRNLCPASIGFIVHDLTVRSPRRWVFDPENFL